MHNSMQSMGKKIFFYAFISIIIVAFLQEGKFSRLYFFPRRFHLTDSLQDVIVGFPAELRNVKRCHSQLLLLAALCSLTG